MQKRRKIGIVPHPFKVTDQFISERIVPVLARRGFDVQVIRPALDLTDPPAPASLPRNHGISIIAVFGGDGTFLSASRLAARAGIPIIGVEMGKLGFLCQSKFEALDELAKSLSENLFATEDRILLEGRIVRKDKVVATDIALNDIVIGNATIPRMLDIDCFVSDTFLVSYLADGLIVSTPTGSTAYAMAAGGPIIAPTLKTMMITPICAHSLYIRPLVMPDDETVRIKPDVTNPPLMATFDGQVFYNLAKGDEVRISRYKKRLKMIRLAEFNFFDTLMKKFKWGFKYTNSYKDAGEK